MNNDTATTILALLKTALGTGTVKQYFDGDPMAIPQSYLPAIIVAQMSSQVVQGATGMDDMTEVFEIRVVVSMMDTMGKSQKEESSHKIVKALVGGLDATGLYQANSVIGVLRTHFVLNSTDGIRIYDQQINTTFDLLTAGRVQKPGVLTEEAHIRFTTKKKILVNTRNAN